MSGIEVAGLLLGAFPLLISALEHYRQGAEVLEDWWHIRKEYNKCKNEIKVQELAFEDNLERFLLPLIVDDHEIAALIAEPGGIKWKDTKLEDKLKRRLPKSYDLFLDTIYDIKSTMDDLNEELGLGREAFQEGLYPDVHRVSFFMSVGEFALLMDLPERHDRFQELMEKLVQEANARSLERKFRKDLEELAKPPKHRIPDSSNEVWVR